MSTFNEKELFQRVADGDENAFREIFHEYNARLLPFILKICKSPLIAEEIVQEVFLRVWINREDLANMDQPVSWLYKVAANLAISYLRKEAVNEKKLLHLATTSAPARNDVIDKLTTKEIQLLIEKAARQLPPRRQQIYRLSRQDGLNHKEIAEKLSLSQNTVKDQLVIALKYIREYIRKESGVSISVLLLLSLL
ncbi:RNA polymerase sigma factor [Chitinophaga defluvii]|uniref:RNA polymerase sigma factor n=1 Tax=Chitinophaga defluvii TaxID=3163343 RepID=A0ABV2T0I4_9BACT